MCKNEQGILFVVGVPIGNIEDITLRAIRILSCVKLILSEDTRMTIKLLSYYGIKNNFLSIHEHNEIWHLNRIIKKIKSGDNIAMVSTAGTPLISDPGFKIVKAAVEKSICIVPVPGPSALITSLSVAGIPTDAFIFLGFLSKKKMKRLEQLKKLSFEKKTLIFYESPKRIVRLLNEMTELWGNRYVVLSREMTKMHEEYLRGNISCVLSEISKKNIIKGECTLIVSGHSIFSEKPSDNIINLVKKYVYDFDRYDCYIGNSILSKYISKKHCLSRKKVYDLILRLEKAKKHKLVDK